MSKPIQDRKLFALYHKIGLKYNLTDAQIRELAESPYEFTKLKLDEINVDNIETEEEFAKLKTNFIYKFLGKIYTSFALVKAKKSRSETYKQINERRWKK